MLARIFTVAVSVFGIWGGLQFIALDRFGPNLVGYGLIGFFSSILIMLIIGIMEQTMNHIANEPEPIWSDAQDDFTFYREINTPDPHLIHPDDAKRQAARLNIKV